MQEFFAAHWESVLLWVSSISLFALLGALVALPWAVTRLPADYFSRPRRTSWRDATPYHSLNVALVLLKNALGLVLVLLGLLMLFTPGQGLLTLLAGVALMNFPGKYYLERQLILRGGVLRGVNWLRVRRGYSPMQMPEQEAR